MEILPFITSSYFFFDISNGSAVHSFIFFFFKSSICFSLGKVDYLNSPPQ